MGNKKVIENLKNRLNEVQARTPVEKTLKRTCQFLLENLRENGKKVEEKKQEPVTLEIPVEKNNLDVLKAFAKENKIEVDGEKNKDDYVVAIEIWLDENS